MIIAAQRNHLKRKIKFHEDEITSCVFGELRHLSPDILWRLFHRLVSSADISEKFWPQKNPTKVEFEFWPKTVNVYPDLIVHFYDENGILLNILIEIKWEAKLFPKCELVRQWQSRKSKDSSWLHLYVVKKIDTGQKEISDSLLIAKGNCNLVPCNQCQEEEKYTYGLKAGLISWKNRLGCLSWHSLVAALKSEGERLIFVKGIERFLNNQGINTFTGFSWLKRESLIFEKDSYEFYPRNSWFLFLKDTAIEDNFFQKQTMDFFGTSKWFILPQQLDFNCDYTENDLKFYRTANKKGKK